jgi:hypothetical protein
MKTLTSAILLIFIGTLAIAAPAVPKKTETETDVEEKPKQEPTDTQIADTLNNFKQVGLAFHNYESAMGVFPGNILDKDGKPLLSWRVAILPYIECDPLYQKFKLDEPWDSVNNKELLESMPKIYQSAREDKNVGRTYIQMFNGKNTLLDKDFKRKLAAIADGCSKTGLVFEANKSIEWTKPDDMPFDPKVKWPHLGHLKGDSFLITMADVSVRWLPRKLDKTTLEHLIMPNDGNVIDLEEAIRKAKD